MQKPPLDYQIFETSFHKRHQKVRNHRNCPRTVLLRFQCARRSTTKSGYWAATSEAAFNKLVTCITAKNEAGIQQLLVSGAVFDLMGGQKVTLLEAGLLSGKVKILLPDGSEAWTFREAVR